MARFKHEILIREDHIDTFGHVNNATYLTLFEEARWEIVSGRGFSVPEIQKNGLGPTILEITLKFVKEVRLRQKVVVETEVLTYPGKVGEMIQEMKNEAGDVCCSALFKIGLFDVRARKLTLPTPEWLKAIGFEAS